MNATWMPCRYVEVERCQKLVKKLRVNTLQARTTGSRLLDHTVAVSCVRSEGMTTSSYPVYRPRLSEVKL